MSKEFAYEAYENLKESLKLKESYPSIELEKIINKNYVLSFYTIWETYAKKKIYDTYIDYEYLLRTEDFIKKYLKKSFGKQYLSNIFLKDIKDTKVKKEILCQSNNLNWNEFEDMLVVIGLDKKRIEDKINQSSSLSNIISVLKALGVMPVQDSLGTSIFDGVKGYLALIVKLRNTISHTYKMEIDENLNNKQMIILINLFKCLIMVIEEYFESEIARLFLEADASTEVIPVGRVLKGCNGTGTQNAILEVNINNANVDFTTKEWIIKSSSNKGYCTIDEIRIGNMILSKIPYNKTCTISVRPNIKIRRSTSIHYELCTNVYKKSEGLNIISCNGL